MLDRAQIQQTIQRVIRQQHALEATTELEKLHVAAHDRHALLSASRQRGHRLLTQPQQRRIQLEPEQRTRRFGQRGQDPTVAGAQLEHAGGAAAQRDVVLDVTGVAPMRERIQIGVERIQAACVSTQPASPKLLNPVNVPVPAKGLPAA